MVARVIEYAYDADGNRVKKTENGVETLYAYDLAGRIATETVGSAVTTYVHDAAGNLVRKETPSELVEYAWDARGRMLQAATVAGDVDFAYDALGRRKRKATPDGEVRSYVYDRNHLLLETDDDGDADRLYTFNNDEWGDLIGEWDAELGSRQHLYDGQWSTQALLDDDANLTDRYRYTAFGLQEKDFGDYDSRMTFVGKQGYHRDDDLSLYYLGMGNSRGGGRFYDPALGRFLSEDPLRQDAGDDNLYRYVKNNPVNVIDPSGEMALHDAGGGGGGGGIGQGCGGASYTCDMKAQANQFLEKLQNQGAKIADSARIAKENASLVSAKKGWDAESSGSSGTFEQRLTTLLGNPTDFVKYVPRCACDLTLRVLTRGVGEHASDCLDELKGFRGLLFTSLPRPCYQAAADVLLKQKAPQGAKPPQLVDFAFNNLDQNCVKAAPGGLALVELAKEYREPLVALLGAIEKIVENRETHKKEIESAVTQLVMGARECVLKIWSDFKNEISGKVETIVAKIAGGAGVVSEIFSQAVCLIFDSVEGAVSAVLNDPGIVGEAVSEGIAEAINPLDSIEQNWKSLTGSVQSAWGHLTDGFQIGQFGSDVRTVFQSAIGIVDSVGLYLYLLALLVPTAIGSIFPVAGNAAGAGIGQTISSVVGVVLGVIDSLLNLSEIVEKANEVWSLIQAKVEEVQNEAKEVLEEGETLDRLDERNEPGQFPQIVFENGEDQKLANLIVEVVSFVVFDGIALALALLGTGAKAVGKAFKKAGGKAKTALSDAATAATKRKTATTRGPLCRSSQCFPAGTPVRVAEGTRPIENVRPGDLVWSCDPEVEVWSLKEVVETYEIDYVGDLATIELASGETLSATAGHPFSVEAGEALEERRRIHEVEGAEQFAVAESDEKGRVAIATGRWVYAGDLLPGDVLVSLDLGRVVVESVSLASTRETTYNFHVADFRTYAVGEDGLLVHNDSRGQRKCKDKDELSESQRVSRDKLLDEHPGLHPDVATESVRGSVSAGGKNVEGGDVTLVNGGRREVTVRTGDINGIRDHLISEASQAGTTEIYMQINTPGVTQEQLLGIFQGPNGLRSANIPDLAGKRVRIFGPEGDQWFDGVFR